MIYSDFRTVTGEAGRGDRALFISLTVASTVLQAAAVMMVIPLLHGLFGARPSEAWPWAGLLVLALVAAWVIDSIATRAGLRLGFAVFDTVEQSALKAIRRLDPAELHGERASRLRDLVATSAPESISVTVLLGAPLIRALLLTPILALMLLFVAWQLAVVALVGGLLLFAVLMASRRAVTRSEEAFADAHRETDDRALEFAWAQPTLRGAGVGTGTLDEVIATSRGRGLRLLAWQLPGDIGFSVVLQLVLIAFGATTGWLYLTDRISGITAAAMIVVLLRIVETVGSLSLLSIPSASAARVLGSVRKLVDEQSADAELPSSAPQSDARQRAASLHPISLRGVGYTYADGTQALRDINLDLPAGSTTVIVGGSGSGKSTLLDVVAGLREPTTGTVAVDGRPAQGTARLADAAVLFQSTQLRPGTLAENVGAADPSALTALAERAQLTDVIAAADAGWATRVGEAGNALSGGERQRVGLARALAKPAGVLLLDEATSALDAITERAVVDALASVRGERTTVIVTHRPALVALADQVVVLDDGRVVDAGSPDELRSRDGVFASLWTRWRESERWQV